MVSHAIVSLPAAPVRMEAAAWPSLVSVPWPSSQYQRVHLVPASEEAVVAASLAVAPVVASVQQERCHLMTRQSESVGRVPLDSASTQLMGP